jgi:PII-like signaling protein
MLTDQGILIRIFVGESDRYQGKPLYEWLLQTARAMDMAGATVLRGMEGFGAHSRVHTTKVLRLAQDLPIIVELVDAEAKVDAYLKAIDPAIEEGLVTTEKVTARFYRPGAKTESSDSG